MPRFYDPQFSWDPVPGAAQYQVEVNPSDDFARRFARLLRRARCSARRSRRASGCCRITPYYWRVRAVDADGNAGQWNVGPSFRKIFDDVTPTIPNLRLRDNTADRVPPAGVSGIATPTRRW